MRDTKAETRVKSTIFHGLSERLSLAILPCSILLFCYSSSYLAVW